MTYIGVPLIVSGLIIKNEDDHFQSLRNTYIPNFRYHYDDYLQYLPAVAMLGLKIGGVQGRSSWSRMLVSEAITAGICLHGTPKWHIKANSTRPDAPQLSDSDRTVLESEFEDFNAKDQFLTGGDVQVQALDTAGVQNAASVNSMFFSRYRSVPESLKKPAPTPTAEPNAEQKASALARAKAVLALSR